MFACSSIPNTYNKSGIYRLSCKAVGGEVVSCNGKTNVSIFEDGTLVKEMQGTCAQNGYTAGDFVGGGVDENTETPAGANADCFAVMGYTCIMKDKSSGNTFKCECDGSCNVALRNLMAGSSNCNNPYTQPSGSDSLDLPLSSPSGESSPSSSESGGESSPSSSGSAGGNSSYIDYSEVLEYIRANTQQTATELGTSNEWLSQIQNNTATANGLLQAIVNKDWSPTINVQAPHVHVDGDTNIINVEVTGDTARAPSEILALMREGGGDPSDTAGLMAQYRDNMHKIDSVVGEGVPDMSDSIGGALLGMHTAFNAIKDTLNGGAVQDSLNKWNNAILNNGVITGNGTNSCPAVLTRQMYLKINGQDIPVDNLGYWLCSPIAGFNVTLWVAARVLLRAFVALTCMLWLYRAVLGVDGGNNEED